MNGEPLYRSRNRTSRVGAVHCAHIQVIRRYSPRPIVASLYDDTAPERLRRQCPNRDKCGIPSSAVMISFPRSLVRNLCSYSRRS
jgi:hypothetical protein